MKVKKGSVAIYVLALMLVTAGYWNYISKETKTLETVSMNQNTQNTNDENLGDATLVSNNEITDANQNNEERTEEEKKIDDYFQESKLSRDTMYSQILQTYEKILNSSNSLETQKQSATEEIKKINDIKNSIMICENLIKTKGFENVVIFVNGDSVSIIVRDDQLNTEKVAQIQNIITREMNTKVENKHISNK